MSSKYQMGEKVTTTLTGRWMDTTNNAAKYHVVRIAKGTANGVEYCHAVDDIPLGSLTDNGTASHLLTVNADGVILVKNSLAGTVNLNDPVIVDYVNTGGTAGYVRSAIVPNFPAMGGTSRQVAGIRTAWKIRADSITFGTQSLTKGVNSHLVLCQNGTSLMAPIKLGTAYGLCQITSLAYTINAPVIGQALDKAISPYQVFRVQVNKQAMKTNT